MPNEKNSESQDLVIVANPVTEKILKRYIDVTPTQEIEEGDKVNEPANEINKEEEVIEMSITDEELTTLLDSGVTEEQLSGKSIEEIKALIPQNNLQQVKTQEQIIITEEMVKEFGFAKNFIGKTVSEAFKAIDEQNKYIESLKKGTVEKKTEEPVTDNQQTKTKTETELESTLSKVDLVNLSPEEQVKKIAEIAQKIVDEKLTQQSKQAEPTPEQIKIANEKFSELFHTQLSKRLPDGADAKQVFADWKIAHKNMSPALRKAYADDPDSLITVISTEYKLKNVDQTKKATEAQKENEVKRETYQRLKKAFANMQAQGSGAKFNFSREGVVKSNDLLDPTGSAEEQMIGKILSRNLS